jgi:hypothetical protein
MNNLSSMNHYPEGSGHNEDESLAKQQCPINEQANIALKSSKETRQAIRRLRESLLNCGVCPHFHKCELQEEFNLQIDLVIAEINEEWGW